jgi:hypothetical protein
MEATTTLALTYESIRCNNAEDYVFVSVQEADRKWHGVVEDYFIDIMVHSSKALTRGRGGML